MLVRMIGTKVGPRTITSKLGEGGMGAVYLAVHDVLRTKCVVKVLLPQWTENTAMVQRFLAEGRAAAAVRHRNIIGIEDCGQLPGGAWYIVMDYLEGGTLGRFCASHGGPLSVHTTLQILAPVASGLEAVHDAGIIHRDLKPENIFLTQQDDNPHAPVVLDFGICKLSERDGGVVTRTGMFAGTPAYCAPEQLRDLKLVDRRSDVYSLAVIAYQMVTGGWFPYQRGGEDYNQVTAPDLFHRQMSEEPIDPRARFAGVPERWASVVLSALHRDPNRRPSTTRAFVLLLAEATPGDQYQANGTDIVRSYARTLLDIGNMLETVRSPKPAAPPPGPSRYEYGEQLGLGGMAEVYRAKVVGAEGFARTVAIKRVLPHYSSVPQFATMFIQEARIASQLNHPNVVSVLDFARDADDRLMLVMEYVEGCDLWKLAQTGPLPPSTTIHIMVEALRGLGYAHELPASSTEMRGVVHRDVSPQNVLLSWDGTVKVSDFGIAKARSATVATASTMVKGKLAYMSPEQVNGQALDGRSDLFAVGVMLWELLAGERLFGGGGEQESVAKVLFMEVPRPSLVRAETPRDLEAVAMRLLARDLSTRYATADAAIDDLLACKDAPRNGRRELAHLLIERFPNAAGVAGAETSSRPTPNSSAPASQPTPLLRPRLTPNPADATVTPWMPAGTTLGNAASQAVHVRARGQPGTGRARAMLLACAGIATATIVAVAVRAGVAKRRDPTASAATPVVTAYDARPDSASSSELTIATHPVAATVYANGHNLGPSPARLRIPRGQVVQVEARHHGHQNATASVVATNEIHPVTLTLAPLLVQPDAGLPDAALPDAALAGAPFTVSTGRESGETPPATRTGAKPAPPRPRASTSKRPKASGVSDLPQSPPTAPRKPFDPNDALED